jgi:hypothetical protein
MEPLDPNNPNFYLWISDWLILNPIPLSDYIFNAVVDTPYAPLLGIWVPIFLMLCITLMILTVVWDYLLIPFLLLYTFLYMKYKIQQYNRKNRRKRRLPKIPKLPY